MPGYMCAACARRLYNRANRPKPRRWPPTAQIVARLDEEIDECREFGLTMGREGHRESATWALRCMAEAMRRREGFVMYGTHEEG